MTDVMTRKVAATAITNAMIATIMTATEMIGTTTVIMIIATAEITVQFNRVTAPVFIRAAKMPETDAATTRREPPDAQPDKPATTTIHVTAIRVLINRLTAMLSFVAIRKAIIATITAIIATTATAATVIN